MMVGRRRLLLLLPAIAVVVLGGLFAVFLVARHGPADEVAEVAESSNASGLTGPAGPVVYNGGRAAEGRYVRDEAGAVAAAAYFATAFDSGAFVDRARRRGLLDRFAASDARDELAASFDQVADTIATRLDLSQDVIDEPGFVWRWIPAGWQVRGYQGDAAVVAIWGVGVFVAQGRQLDQPGWSTVEVGLRWERNAWRLVSVRNEPGPTPPLAGSVEASAVGRRIAGFATFEHRPSSSGES